MWSGDILLVVEDDFIGWDRATAELIGLISSCFNGVNFVPRVRTYSGLKKRMREAEERKSQNKPQQSPKNRQTFALNFGGRNF